MSDVTKKTKTKSESSPVEKAFEAMPEVRSVGYMRIAESSNSWVSYVITSKGNDIISIVMSEPNIKAIAEEASKIDFVRNFMDRGQ